VADPQVPEAPEHEAPAGTVEEVAQRQQQDEGVISRLVDEVRNLAAVITGSQRAAEPAQEATPDRDPGSMAEEVRREVAKLSASEERKRRADEHAQQHADLAAAVEKIRERAPREYSLITKAMGWISEDDR
jgi:hypothetical protein